LPIQTRADYLEKCERLAAHAIQKAKQHIVISYAQTYTTSSSTTRPDKLSQIFQPIYVDQGDAVTYEPLTIDAKHAPTRVQSFDSYEPDHISFTQISEYLRCPHRYYLSRVLNLPSEPSPAMIYGRSLHEGIAIGGFARQENRKDICAVQEEALKAYTKAWQSGVFESKKQEFDLFSKGKNVLQKFVEQDMQAKDDDPVVKMVEMSFDLFVPEVDMTLRGVWDRIEEDHDGAKHILEYKSNMSGLDRDVKKLARESLQLKLYLFAYHCIFQEKPRGAVLQMIEDPKRITNGLHINQLDGFVPYNEEKDKTQVLEVMTKVTQGLRKGNFHPVPNYLECALCPFRNSACNHSA
jgi:ATP-dependent helicase/DNAse subunit B